MNTQESAVYQMGAEETRKQIAIDIEILKENCIHNEINKAFIAGLETARDIVTGSITLHPSAYDDPSLPPPLFDDDL